MIPSNIPINQLDITILAEPKFAQGLDIDGDEVLKAIQSQLQDKTFLVNAKNIDYKVTIWLQIKYIAIVV